MTGKCPSSGSQMNQRKFATPGLTGNSNYGTTYLIALLIRTLCQIFLTRTYQSVLLMTAEWITITAIGQKYNTSMP